ncbi:hypothetical protein CEXT_716141 [Caerostris extrusa]|uniref:Uncharacterized protein n=1 Tax=Caerostris extrusa TaxID=172846 RepID=A0AAV4PXE9_CAEEX|nr:hypothetical protein CEXT_716141 [Caerostris extrusa]
MKLFHICAASRPVPSRGLHRLGWSRKEAGEPGQMTKPGPHMAVTFVGLLRIRIHSTLFFIQLALLFFFFYYVFLPSSVISKTHAKLRLNTRAHWPRSKLLL